MKPAPFRYARPATVAEAVALLASSPGEAKLLAGGQSLVPLLNMRLVRPAVLVDLNGARELLGAKGVGEGGSIPGPAAVANAVEDALAHLGVVVRSLPITPEQVWRWLSAAESAGSREP